MIYPSINSQDKKEKSLARFVFYLRDNYKKQLLPISVGKLLESIPGWMRIYPSTLKEARDEFLFYTNNQTVMIKKILNDDKWNTKKYMEFAREHNSMIRNEKDILFLPIRPDTMYPNEWKGWNHFLHGKKRVKTFKNKKDVLDFIEEYEKSGINSLKKFCKQKNKPYTWFFGACEKYNINFIPLSKRNMKFKNKKDVLDFIEEYEKEYEKEQISMIQFCKNKGIKIGVYYKAKYKYKIPNNKQKMDKNKFRRLKKQMTKEAKGKGIFLKRNNISLSNWYRWEKEYEKHKN